MPSVALVAWGERMKRYRVLRRIGLDPLASAFVAALNWVMGAPQNEVRFMTVIIEFDPAEV